MTGSCQVQVDVIGDEGRERRDSLATPSSTSYSVRYADFLERSNSLDQNLSLVRRTYQLDTSSTTKAEIDRTTLVSS